MKRHELEHIIRASVAIAGSDPLIIIGSQSILGAFPDAPDVLRQSMEADLYPRDAPSLADLIEGSIGEGSPFHSTFGYYAQAVDATTATLPPGWEERLIPICNANTDHHTGLCLEPHDLCVAKLAAARDKDLEFVSTALSNGLVEASRLEQRCRELGEPLASRATGLLRRLQSS